MEENKDYNSMNTVSGNAMGENAVGNTETQQNGQQAPQTASSNEGIRVRTLRITAIKGYLIKSVDLPVDEDGMKWLRRIFAMDKSTINVEGNGKNTLKVRFSLLQGDKVF